MRLHMGQVLDLFLSKSSPLCKKHMSKFSRKIQKNPTIDLLYNKNQQLKPF